MHLNLLAYFPILLLASISMTACIWAMIPWNHFHYKDFLFFIFQFWFHSYDLSILSPFDLVFFNVIVLKFNIFCDWTFILRLATGNLAFFSIFLRNYPLSLSYLTSISVSSILILILTFSGNKWLQRNSNPQPLSMWTNTQSSLAKWLSVCSQTKCGCGFESRCSHLNFRFCTCFKQRVPWHPGNYRVCIHCQTRTWHDKNIQFR